MGRRGGVIIQSTPISLSEWCTIGRIIQIAEVSPQGLRSLSLTSSSLVWGSCTRHMSPQNVWLCKSAGLTFRRPRGLWEIEIPHLKGIPKISHAPWHRAEAVIWRSLGQTYQLISEILLENQEATRTHPGNTDTGGNHFWELVLSYGQWCWQGPFWNPSSILFASRPRPTPTKQPVGTSTKTP